MRLQSKTRVGVLIGVGLFLCVSNAAAETTSRPCPFSCSTEGIPKEQCRDWKEGDTCFVDDQRPSAQRPSRGEHDGRRHSERRDGDHRRDDYRGRASDNSDSYDRRDRGDRDDRRDIQTIKRVLRRGDSRTIELRDERIDRIDVVAARDRGGRDTRLELSLDGSGPIGAPQQVDREDNHVLRFDPRGQNPRGRELVLRALDGDVFVESVHVIYKR